MNRNQLCFQLKKDYKRKTAMVYLLFFCLLYIFSLTGKAATRSQKPGLLSGQVLSLTMEMDTSQNVLLSSTDRLSLYYSSNPYVVNISESGLLTAHNTGTAQIIYNHFDQLICCKIQVSARKTATSTFKKDDSSFTLKDTLLFMELGDSYKVEINDRAGLRGNIYNDFSWSSDDTGVARVDMFGKITAKGNGSATITCRRGSHTARVYVNVISNDYSGKACDFSILTANGEKRTYRLFKQNAHNYPKYDKYIAWHGCATCSLASVLGAYNDRYCGILPNEVIDGPEKETVKASSWQREHVERALPKQMPLSLYGISSILSKYNVNNTYIRTYEEKTAREDILSHLKTGNPIIFEVGQRNNKTGKKNQRWTNSYHTMVFLGALTNGKVFLYDAIDRSWYEGGDRVKIVELDDLMRFMFPCTEFSESMYYNGAKSDGGYIKVYD
ncbi:MAG: Ig-like domain-containing protein [Lachnospiraceae bacterium]|nr:Ig-like domain-containing protein [Lachnospiraceae bacterium]